jgi:FkbM family methyltransferase
MFTRQGKRPIDRLVEPWMFLYRLQCLENPFAAFSARIGMSTHLHFRTGLDFKVPAGQSEERWAIVSSLIWLSACGAELVAEREKETEWSVDQRRGTVTTPQGLVFTLDSLEIPIFIETFVSQIHYEGADLSGKIVVCAGAFVGDTALFYANQGAEVYAFEPDPDNFAKLRKNLDLNACGSRVHAFQEAVGREGAIAFRVGQKGGSHFSRGSEASNVTLNSVSLPTILRRLPAPPFLLQADIKGAEYEIAKQPEIRAFQRLEIEYTADTPAMLSGLMGTLREQGFVGGPSNPNRAPIPLTHWGLIRMDRRGSQSELQ